MTQQIQGVTCLKKGWRRQEKEGIVFPGRRSSQYKSWVHEDYNKSLNLQVFLCSWLSASGEVSKSETGLGGRSGYHMVMTQDFHTPLKAKGSCERSSSRCVTWPPQVWRRISVMAAWRMDEKGESLKTDFLEKYSHGWQQVKNVLRLRWG